MSHQKVRIAYLGLFLPIDSVYQAFVRVAFDSSDRHEGVLLSYDPSQQGLIELDSCSFHMTTIYDESPEGSYRVPRPLSPY
jgi:hypothetical protein